MLITCDWHARNVDKGSAITAAEAAAFSLSPEPSQEVIGMNGLGRIGEMPPMFGALAMGFMSMTPMPMPIPIPIGDIIDIWSCCCIAIGNIIGGMLIDRRAYLALVLCSRNEGRVEKHLCP